MRSLFARLMGASQDVLNAEDAENAQRTRRSPKEDEEEFFGCSSASSAWPLHPLRSKSRWRTGSLLGRPPRLQFADLRAGFLAFGDGPAAKFIRASTRIGLGDNHLDRSGFENAARVNRRLLHERFGRITTRHLEHCATPLRKSVLLEMEQAFAAEFAATAASRFRAKDNISVTNSLYHYYALLTGRAVTQENAKVRYVDTTVASGLASLNQLLKKRSHDFFCLNDGSFPEVSADERVRLVTGFLENYFPIAAPWETEDDPVAGREQIGQHQQQVRLPAPRKGGVHHGAR